MRADHAVRHNAAVGLIVGLAVGGTLSQQHDLPAQISGGALSLPPWGDAAEQCFANAERLLRGDPIDMIVSATGVAAGAIALADPDASPPLLADPDAVVMCGLVRDARFGRLNLGGTTGTSPIMQRALAAVNDARSFDTAVTTELAHDVRPLAGALAGLRWGAASIPSAWMTTVAGPVESRQYGLRQLRRLAERLMQQAAPIPPEPRRALGPRQVAPRLWLSNLHAVPRFLAAHPNGAVISLCPTTGAFDNHLFRREFVLHDAAGSKVNPLLPAIVDEVLATIAAFHQEDRDVLVHCHHGASRTGLVLRCWLMQELGLTADEATTEADVLWSKTSTWNQAFNAEVRRRENGVF